MFIALANSLTLLALVIGGGVALIFMIVGIARLAGEVGAIFRKGDALSWLLFADVVVIGGALILAGAR